MPNAKSPPGPEARSALDTTPSASRRATTSCRPTAASRSTAASPPRDPA
ncbi:MAG: hypothetical protein MZW92_28585 [Comamonadaceae bacterium]|nr:hypothetical protein [Comamonadaceae bacterium]